MGADPTSGRRPLGRATELAQLERILVDAEGGRGRLVILTGEPGVGKSALAYGFLSQVKRSDPNAVTLSAQCIEGHSAFRPYGPFRDLVASLGGMGAESGFLALVSDEASGWLPGAPQSAGRDALFESFLKLCHAIASQRTLVLMIDDLQWTDRSSLDLLARFTAALATLPVVLLATYEETGSDTAPSIKALLQRAGANATELAIRGLEAEAIHQLAEDVLGGSLASDLGDWFIKASRGIPLRAKHLSLLAQEAKLVRKKLFRYSARQGRLPNPGTKIGDIISKRLDALEPNVRWTLEGAALSGSVIDSAVVTGQVGKRGDEILAQLQSAEAAHGIIERIGGRQWSAGKSSLRYRFAHPIVRGVLRSRVSGKRREHLLTRAAAMLERLAGDGAGQIADEIAILHLAGDDRSKGAEWASRAADLCERLYGLYELEEFLRTAARLVDHEGEQLGLRYRLAKLYAATGNEPEAERMLQRVFEISQEQDAAPLAIRAGAMLGWMQLERGAEPHELSALAGDLVDVARSSAGPRELVMALDLSCVIAERIGRAEEALLMAEEAQHVAASSDDPEVQAQAAYRLARVHVSWGSPDEGRSLADRALELFTELDARGGIAECHDLLGNANFRAGDWDRALHHWESALKRMQANGASEQKIAMQANIAELVTLRGEFDRALTLFGSGLDAALELEIPDLELRCRTGIARLEFERGDYASVLELTDEIRDLLEESGSWKYDFQVAAVRALAYLELGDEVQAWQEAAKLEQLYQGKEGWFERRPEGDAVRIRVIDLDSDAWLAGMVAQQGIGETSGKDPYGEGFLQYHQACVQARARTDEARAAAERAVELFEKLGAAPMLGRARQLLSQLGPGGPAEQSAEDGGIDEDKLDKWFDSLEG